MGVRLNTVGNKLSFDTGKVKKYEHLGTNKGISALMMALLIEWGLG